MSPDTAHLINLPGYGELASMLLHPGSMYIYLREAFSPLWGWAVTLLPRTHDPSTGVYGSLYSNLLDYVISAALLFYTLAQLLEESKR